MKSYASRTMNGYLKRIVSMLWKEAFYTCFTIITLYHFQQYFSYIMVTSFSGGGSRSTWREPPTMGKQLVNIITCDCESSAPFLAHLAFAKSMKSYASRTMNGYLKRIVSMLWKEAFYTCFTIITLYVHANFDINLLSISMELLLS
jgi:hypothetical protein